MENDQIDAVSLAFASLALGELKIGQHTNLPDGTYAVSYNKTVTISYGQVVEVKVIGGYGMDRSSFYVDTDKCRFIGGIDLSRVEIGSMSRSARIGDLTTRIVNQGQAHRDCPPNQVQKFKQVLAPFIGDLRQALVTMEKNSYMSFSASVKTSVLGASKSKEVPVEIWFEDDLHFHVYKDSKRVFQSREAKKIVKFVENELL